MTHVASFIILLWRLHSKKSAAGLSLKTQQLYLLVFVTRYLDIFTNHLSLYNTFMKALFIGMSGTICYLIMTRPPLKASYAKEEDTFQMEKFLIAPCAVLALLINQDFRVMEVLWTFSIYLEAVVILPQIVILSRHGAVENLTSHYVFSLGAYRAFYLINWIWRYWHEPHYRQYIVWTAGTVQTLLYADFFYYYIKSRLANKAMTLPSSNN